MSIISEIRPVDIIAFIILAAAVVFIVLCFTYLIRNLPPKAAVWGMIAGFVIAAAALIVLLAPRQHIALFAPGEGNGEAERFTESEDDGVLRIRVREDRIWFNEREIADREDLVSELIRAGEQSEEGKDNGAGADMAVVLTDDYASAAAWHEAEEALTEAGLTWQSERID